MPNPVFWLSLVGQVLGLIGALYTIANPFLTKKVALEIGVPRWAGRTDEINEQLPLVQELLKQSHQARIGLAFIATGFLLQALATIMSR